ncbi:glycosyltransferase [Campylobacter sp. RM16192]|uniref:glycosyltransferase n=1 Tax=Campylobacter sp. RM16192 TaxID=1660080 RepID=UPI0014518AED|nr:glycosyltransferase [Campylobacter sp. RM16192]QCD53352.1 glycosyltransferase, family 1 [Campylobacter sp. RM16192]
MKVALFVRHNSFGGSIKVSRFLYDILKQNGYEVEVVLIRNDENNGFFNDIKTINFTNQNFKKDWFYVRRFLFFKKLIKNINPDIVISTVNLNMPYISIFSKFLGKKVIISEHGNHQNIKKIKKKILRFLSYKLSNIVVLLTKFDLGYFKNFKNCIQIYNPFYVEKIQSKKQNIILFPNRIDKNKRLLFLLKAFLKTDKNLQKKYKIIVCGDGEERQKCEEFAKNNNINLEIKGYVPNINEYYAKSKIVALTSISEGLPNTLIESIFFECARISADCVSGPSELIDNNFDGFLIHVNDINDFSQKLEILMSDNEKIQYFCKNARLREDDFNPDKISKIWLENLKRVANENIAFYK